MGRFCVCMEVDTGNDRGVEPRERVVGKKLGLLRDSTRSRPRRVGKDPDSFPLPHRSSTVVSLLPRRRRAHFKSRQLGGCFGKANFALFPARARPKTRLGQAPPSVVRFASGTCALAFASGPGRKPRSQVGRPARRRRIFTARLRCRDIYPQMLGTSEHAPRDRSIHARYELMRILQAGKDRACVNMPLDHGPFLELHFVGRKEGI